MKGTLILLTLLYAFSLKAAIWIHDSNRQWDNHWQQAYSQWIENEVNGTYFKDLGEPYASLYLDCADTHYALTAYFARAHRLPFSVNSGRTTNLLSRFDHILDPDQRLSAFIDYLQNHYGTESLVHKDSYPPPLDQLMPGDLFMWKTGSKGNHTRHTYIIKKINSNGAFDVLYSTQASAALYKPLRLRQNFMFRKAPKNTGQDKNRWGFRRMKLPQHSKLKQEAVPGASLSQYELARNSSSLHFFIQVQEANQMALETPEETFNRLFQSLCSSVIDRIDIVNKGLKQRDKLNGQCMDFRDYDTHSTPARDSGIMSDYDRLEYYLNKFSEEGSLYDINSETRKLIMAIFSNALSEAGKEKLYEYCPINFGPQPEHKTELSAFREALFSSQVSYHPNDSLLQRWGFDYSPRTTCQEFYGYPGE